MGVRGQLGVCRGVRGTLVWQVDWKPDHIGPQSRVQALPLVPLGSDLPHQGQARALVEDLITPTVFLWGVT